MEMVAFHVGRGGRERVEGWKEEKRRGVLRSSKAVLTDITIRSVEVK